MEEKSPKLYYGWVIVGVSFLTIFLALGIRYSFGVFYVAILKDYQWGRGETAGAFSLALAVHAGFSPVTGSLVDRFGPRKLFPIGALFLTLGLSAASQISMIWQLYLFFGVVTAIGVNSLSYTPHMSVIPKWFIKKRGLASGLVLAGIGLGTMALAPFIQKMIDTVGWRCAFLVLGAIVLCTVFPLTAIFQRASPQEVGQRPDEITRNLDDVMCHNTTSSMADANSLHTSKEWTLKRALRTKAFWCMFLVLFTNGFVMNMLVVHQAAYLVDRGYSEVLAATSIGAVGLLGSIGGIFCAFLSDRFGREIGFTIGGAAAFLGVLHLLLLKDTTSPRILYLFVVFYGLGNGSTSPISAAKTGDLFPGKSLGKILGILSTGFGLGGALGAYSGGHLYDVTGNYFLAFILLLASICIGVVAIWMASISTSIKSLK